MYRLIIVDDDEIICNGLSHNLKWAEQEIEVVGTAYDGEAGLELIRTHRPDIALVDINLPFLDGLELSGIIRQEYPEIKIILLTAHEEFEFAKKAVQLHVHDYITKPFDNQKVIESVCGAKLSLAGELAIRDKIIEGLPLLKDKYLYQLVTRAISPDKETEIRNFIGLPPDGYFSVFVLRIRNYYLSPAVNSISEINTLIVNEQMMQQKIFLAVQGLLDPSKTVVFNGRDDEIAIICKDFENREVCEAYMADAAQEILRQISHPDEYCLTMSLGTAARGFDHIAKSYEEAKTALEYGRYFENHSIIRFGDFAIAPNHVELNIGEAQKEIVACLKMGRFEDALGQIDQLFLAIQRAPGMYFSYVQMIAVETIILACKSIDEDGEIQDKLIKLSTHVIPQVIVIESITDIAKWLKSKLAEVMELVAAKRQSGAEKAIAKAVAYIEENFTNPDLTLIDVADFIHLSPNYFSALFRQLKNVSFSDYLESLRIQQAVQLFINTDSKIYEVAYRVGYNSPQYFSICFKKITGRTPSDYKMNMKP